MPKCSCNNNLLLRLVSEICEKKILHRPSRQNPPWSRATDTVLAVWPCARQTRCVARVTRPVTVLVLSLNTRSQEDTQNYKLENIQLVRWRLITYRKWGVILRVRMLKRLNHWCQIPNVMTSWAKCGEAMQNLTIIQLIVQIPGYLACTLVRLQSKGALKYIINT